MPSTFLCKYENAVSQVGVVDANLRYLGIRLIDFDFSRCLTFTFLLSVQKGRVQEARCTCYLFTVHAKSMSVILIRFPQVARAPSRKYLSHAPIAGTLEKESEWIFYIYCAPPYLFEVTCKIITMGKIFFFYFTER